MTYLFLCSVGCNGLIYMKPGQSFSIYGVVKLPLQTTRRLHLTPDLPTPIPMNPPLFFDHFPTLYSFLKMSLGPSFFIFHTFLPKSPRPLFLDLIKFTYFPFFSISFFRSVAFLHFDHVTKCEFVYLKKFYFALNLN